MHKIWQELDVCVCAGSGAGRGVFMDREKCNIFFIYIAASDIVFLVYC